MYIKWGNYPSMFTSIVIYWKTKFEWNLVVGLELPLPNLGQYVGHIFLLRDDGKILGQIG